MPASRLNHRQSIVVSVNNYFAYPALHAFQNTKEGYIIRIIVLNAVSRCLNVCFCACIILIISQFSGFDALLKKI
jgi:hypothetical protein